MYQIEDRKIYANAILTSYLHILLFLFVSSHIIYILFLPNLLFFKLPNKPIHRNQGLKY